jgi:hypothetical protein
VTQPPQENPTKLMATAPIATPSVTGFSHSGVFISSPPAEKAPPRVFLVIVGSPVSVEHGFQVLSGDLPHLGLALAGHNQIRRRLSVCEEIHVLKKFFFDKDFVVSGRQHF